jgi:hypothetical protein
MSILIETAAMRGNTTKTGLGLKRMLGGIVTLFLLTPVPLWATITFNGWNPVSITGDPLFSSVDTSNPSQLTFYLNGGNRQASGTTTITSLPLTLVTEPSTLNGSWSGLHSLAIQDGSVTITVTVGTSAATTNMFGGASGVTLDKTSTYDSGPLTPTSNVLNNTSWITVKFDYSSGIDSHPQSATHFTLTFGSQ